DDRDAVDRSRLRPRCHYRPGPSVQRPGPYSAGSARAGARKREPRIARTRLPKKFDPPRRRPVRPERHAQGGDEMLIGIDWGGTKIEAIAMEADGREL